MTGTLETWTVEMALGRLASFRAAPALIAVRGGSVESLSYAELVERVRSLAAGLPAAGMTRGTLVALIVPNGFDWVVARLALAAVGAVAVALDDLASAPELADLIRDCGCRHVLMSANHADLVPALEHGIALWLIGESPAPEGTRDWQGLFRAPSSLASDGRLEGPALFTYTSGTTGPPKGFFLSYGNLAANLVPLAGTGLIGPGDRVLLPLPLHHIFPFLVGLLTPLSLGAAVVFPEAISGPKIIEAIASAEVTTIVGVPRLYAALASGIGARGHGKLADRLFRIALRVAIGLRRRFGLDAGRWLFRGVRAQLGPKLHLFVSGGAHLDSETLWLLAGLGFEVRSGYGLAEAASTFTGNLPGAERLGSEGKPFQGGRMRIAAPDEDGVGEIELSGANLCSGYSNPTADRDAFTADGWFRTGDLGRIDADGFLYVTGRRKETIVLGGGKKVNPEALERIYGTNPFIREIAVLERRGSLVALVVPDMAAARTGPSARIDETIRVALASQSQLLPSYERLAGFALAREALPRTRFGKYRRFLLPALYERALAGRGSQVAAPPSPADEALLGRPRARRLYDILLARYPDRVSLDANPQLDLGIDSLEWVSLSLTLNEAGVALPERAWADALTVRDLLRLAEASASGSGEAPAQRGKIDERWLAPTGWGLAALGFVLYLVDWSAMRLLFRLRVRGAEHLPATGPCVIAANHASDLDALAIVAALDYRRARRLYWGGDATRLFRRRWLDPLWRALHVFPADDRFPERIIAAAEAVLARGNDLGWFPEGWRTPDGKIQHFYPGIGRILAQTRVPVIPVHIAGTFEAWPRNRRLPRFLPIRVSIGPPIPVGPMPPGPAAETQEQAIADRLRGAIVSLAAMAMKGSEAAAPPCG